jgi:hypothetical protein
MLIPTLLTPQSAAASVLVALFHRTWRGVVDRWRRRWRSGARGLLR